MELVENGHLGFAALLLAITQKLLHVFSGNNHNMKHHFCIVNLKKKKNAEDIR